MDDTIREGDEAIIMAEDKTTFMDVDPEENMETSDDYESPIDSAKSMEEGRLRIRFGSNAASKSAQVEEVRKIRLKNAAEWYA